jgi:peptidyl-dipeptidase Dcp
MRRRSFLHSAALAALAQVVGNAMTSDALAAAAKQGANPLLDEWTGPHGGCPRFDLVKVDAFKPAMMKGMDLNRVEIAAIAGNRAAPNFENTFAAFDNAGRPFGRATRIFHVYALTMNDKRMQAVETEMAPLLSAFDDEIVQNKALFVRLKAVYDARAKAKLSPEQQRLVDVVYTNFARQGAALGNEDKARLKAINKRLASLFTTFRQNVLADEEDYTLVIDNEADLACRKRRPAAADAAGEKGLKGKWSSPIRLVDGAVHHHARAAICAKRDGAVDHARRQPGRPHNNPLIAVRILQLRAQRAKPPGLCHPCALDPDNNMARPGRGHGSDDEGVEGGRRARPRGNRRHAGLCRHRRRRDQDRAVGLPLLRGESTQGQIRRRSNGNQPVSATR